MHAPTNNFYNTQLLTFWKAGCIERYLSGLGRRKSKK